MTDLKNNLEEVWREELRVWINHNLSETQSILIHDLCERAYIEAKSRNRKEIKNLLELTETLNQIRDNLQDENRKLEQELQKTKEQLEVAEAVLGVQCTDSALAYFKDKQGE